MKNQENEKDNANAKDGKSGQSGQEKAVPVQKEVKVIGRVNFNLGHAELEINGYEKGDTLQMPFEPFTEFIYHGEPTQIVVF